MGFFWITVNNVLFAFGVIIWLWLHVVINIYTYLAFIERKNTWWTSVKRQHPLKEKMLVEQVSRGLLNWDCEKLFQFIPKEKLLLLTCVGRRILEKSSLECSSDGDGLIIFWATVEMEYLHLDIADDIANISSSLLESYASSPHSELWPVMFFISHFRNPKDFNFRTVDFLAEWFVILSFAHKSANGDFFFRSAQHCVYCIDPYGLIFIPNIS